MFKQIVIALALVAGFAGAAVAGPVEDLAAIKAQTKRLRDETRELKAQVRLGKATAALEKARVANEAAKAAVSMIPR